MFKNRLKSRNKTEKRNIINKTEKENKINKKLKLENINKTLDTNKFPVIPKLNIKNIKKENDEIITNEEIKQNNNLLEYKLIESSSEDSIHKLKDIKNGSGWQSSRFCEYPQYIYIHSPHHNGTHDECHCPYDAPSYDDLCVQKCKMTNKTQSIMFA